MRTFALLSLLIAAIVAAPAIAPAQGPQFIPFKCVGSIGNPNPCNSDETDQLPTIERNTTTQSVEGDTITSPVIVPMARAASVVWAALKPWRGKTKTNGKTGKDREYYEWDNTHGEIEVYDRRGQHKGVIDPKTGDQIKPPVKGRNIDVD